MPYILDAAELGLGGGDDDVGTVMSEPGEEGVSPQARIANKVAHAIRAATTRPLDGRDKPNLKEYRTQTPDEVVINDPAFRFSVRTDARLITRVVVRGTSGVALHTGRNVAACVALLQEPSVSIVAIMSETQAGKTGIMCAVRDQVCVALGVEPSNVKVITPASNTYQKKQTEARMGGTDVFHNPDMVPPRADSRKAEKLRQQRNKIALQTGVKRTSAGVPCYPDGAWCGAAGKCNATCDDAIAQLKEELCRTTDSIVVWASVARNAVIFVDECHLACGPDNTFFKHFMRWLGGVTGMRLRNIKIVAVSATLGRVKTALETWHTGVAFVGMEPPREYVGLRDHRAAGRIFSAAERFDLSTVEQARKSLHGEAQLAAFEPKYMIFRMPSGCAAEQALLGAVAELNNLDAEEGGVPFDYVVYDMHTANPVKERYIDIKALLQEQPEVFTVILVRGLLRCAATIWPEQEELAVGPDGARVKADRHLWMVYEKPVAATDACTVAQSLAGRCCGYVLTPGPTGVRIFVSREALEQYMEYCDADYEFNVDLYQGSTYIVHGHEIQAMLKAAKGKKARTRKGVGGNTTGWTPENIKGVLRVPRAVGPRAPQRTVREEGDYDDYEYDDAGGASLADDGDYFTVVPGALHAVPDYAGVAVSCFVPVADEHQGHEAEWETWEATVRSATADNMTAHVLAGAKAAFNQKVDGCGVPGADKITSLRGSVFRKKGLAPGEGKYTPKWTEAAAATAPTEYADLLGTVAHMGQSCIAVKVCYHAGVLGAGFMYVFATPDEMANPLDEKDDTRVPSPVPEAAAAATAENDDEDDEFEESDDEDDADFVPRLKRVRARNPARAKAHRSLGDRALRDPQEGEAVTLRSKRSRT